VLPPALCPTIAQIFAVVLKLSLYFHRHVSCPVCGRLVLQFSINNQQCLGHVQKRTKKDLLAHPFAARLRTCDSPAAVLAILQEQVQGLDQTQRGDERWSKWLDPTVNVLFAFSATIGAGAGLVCLRTCTHPRSDPFSYSFGRYFLPRV
jgi:hypothetical protein